MTNYFKCGNDKRQDEYHFCLNQNIANEYIDKIVLLAEDDVNVENDKLEIINQEERPTYKDFFELANKNYRDEIVILTNLDIFFDETLEKVKNYDDFDNSVMALSRWDVIGPNNARLFNQDNSQDVWIFKSPINMEDMECDFYMGKRGCDNRIAYELDKNYNVINPAKSVKCYHLHNINYRTYKDPGQPGYEEDVIPEPYKRIELTEL